MYSFQKLISAFKMRICYDGKKNYALFFSFLLTISNTSLKIGLLFFLVNPTKIICGLPQKSQKNHLKVGVSVNIHTRFKKNRI